MLPRSETKSYYLSVMHPEARTKDATNLAFGPSSGKQLVPHGIELKSFNCVAMLGSPRDQRTVVE